LAAPSAGRKLYQTLGVSPDADADALKKAYRKLAQEYHPDRNQGDEAAEERFKEVSAAYAVLSDDQRRRDYDEFGEIATDPNFDAERARQASGGFGGFGGAGARGFGHGAGGEAQDFGGFGNLFEDLFGGGRQQRPRRRRGSDIETTLTLDFVDAARGCEQAVTLERPTTNGTRREQLTVHVPPGVDDGGRIRLAGKGSEGEAGGPPGDLLARIKLRPHPFFERDGRDLKIELPISIVEAVLGAEIDVPTLDGSVTLRVPPGTDGGTRLRLRGKGIPAHGGKPAGDYYVTTRVRVPKKLSQEAAEQLAGLLDDDPDSWRREIFG
jgi:DnaJ-class molecular chaperone